MKAAKRASLSWSAFADRRRASCAVASRASDVRAAFCSSDSRRGTRSITQIVPSAMPSSVISGAPA